MTVHSFFKGIPEYASTTRETGASFNCEDFANITMEAIYILDFQERRFHYVSDHEFFLCGHSQEEVMNLGYEFFYEVVHPEDLSLWKKMHSTILKRLNKLNSIDEVDYFSCTFRIKGGLLTGNSSCYLMAYQKLMPKYIDGQLRFGICLLSLSVIRTPGNLQLYYKNKPDYDTYSDISQKWKNNTIQPLSDRQKAILVWAKQGKSRKETANILCVSINTIDAEKSLIFEKLGVKTIGQAIIYATNHRMIFGRCPADSRFSRKEDTPKKQDGNHFLTPDILGLIQDGLNNGQSVNSLAIKVGFSETALRKAIKCGRLKKKNQ